MILLFVLIGVADSSTNVVIGLVEFVFGDVSSFREEVSGGKPLRLDVNDLIIYFIPRFVMN